MRKITVCALMMTLCLLAACGGRGTGNSSTDELALDIRTEYLSMTGCTTRMAVTADYGQRVYSYVLDMSYQKEGDTTLTVVEPEEVAGVTARMSGDSATLEYDGISLETGPLDGSGLSPLSAAPALLRCAMEGFIAESALETVGESECLKMVCRDPDGQPGEGIEVSLWFDTGSHALVQGEILSDGTRVVDCTFTEFSMVA